MNRDSIYLPRDVIGLLQTLQSAGHTAYVVGGCVRDSLLGRTPGDWDICTSARPEEMRRLFADHQLILTGEKHGTVAVVLHGKPYEMTTYRLDGNYHDHRHPDAVQFVDDLPRDLARRDFTINAMAYAPGKGIIDLYGGRDDLAAGMIRCVGDPAQRFAEDALRILRALRFSARLGFALDEATAAAALQARDTLQSVSAERIYTEIDGLLGAPNAGPTLAKYGEILAGAVPEVQACICCTQPGRWHCYDVWQHSAVAVEKLDLRGQDTRGARVLCWAAFLHDIAKPQCRSVGADGAAHFKGHNQRGAVMARTILRRLKAPGYLIEGTTGLIAIHDAPVPAGDTAILKSLNRYGAVFLHRLCALKYADLDAHADTPEVKARRNEVAAFEARMTELSKTACYTMRQLAVNGGDLMEAGLPAGPAVGATLQRLLTAVMEGRVLNERAALLEFALSGNEKGESMIFGIGTDLCAADRMAAKLQKPAFVQRVFSPAEQALLNERGGTHRAETAAANFAAKEAFLKAAGTGLGGFALTDLTVLRKESGAPYFALTGPAAEWTAANALTPHLSLTHENGLACAFVILEQNK